VKIKWLGHACVLVTSQKGIRIITDPYPRGWIYRGPLMRMDYPLIDEEANIILLTHNHSDHNNLAAIRGNPEVVREAGKREVDEIPIIGVRTRHGTFRTQNIVYCFEVDGIRMCHLGDLGHLLNDAQLAEIGEVDILFATFSGFPVMKPEGMAQVCLQLEPKIIIPIHWRTPKCNAFFFAKPERVYRIFSEIAADVQWMEINEAEFTKDRLPEKTIVQIFPPFFPIPLEKEKKQDEGE